MFAMPGFLWQFFTGSFGGLRFEYKLAILAVQPLFFRNSGSESRQ